MKEKSLKKSYIFNLIYNLINLVVPLFIAPYLSRILEVDGEGIKSYTLSIVSNFILFASLGSAEYGQLEISKYRDNKYMRSKKLYEIGLLRCVTTIIVLVIYIFTFVTTICNTSYNIIYAILIINIIANMLDFSWFLRGIEEFKSITYIQIFSKIIMLVSIFSFVKVKENLNLAILINSSTLLINSLLSLVKIKKYCTRVKLKELKIFSHIKDCFIFFVPAIAIQIYTVLDKTMIGVITNSAVENGYYEQADKIVKILITVVTTTNTIMNSRISYLYKNNRNDEIDKLIQKSLRLCMLISIPITFGIISIADIFISIFFGAGYEKSSILLIILAPLSIIIGLSGLIGSHYYTPLGKKKISNKFLIIGSIVNFISNLILIPKLATIGAAIASVMAELIITVLYVRFCDKKLFNLNKIINVSYKYFISAAIMSIIIIIMKKYLSVNIMSLVGLVGLGCIIYFGIIIVIKDRFVLEIINEYCGKLKMKLKN